MQRSRTGGGEVAACSTTYPDLLGYAAEIGIAMLDWLAEQQVE